MFRNCVACFALVVLLAGCGASAPKSDGPPPPAVGESAPPLALKTLDGAEVSLAQLQTAGPVLIVQLRGWVGYQCPLCTTQVGDLLAHAEEFKAKKATVVLVYPGPADAIDAKAKEFISGKTLPEHFRFVLDPDLAFVDAWRLRWDAPKETALPSTFVVDKQGVIQFAKVSHSHGDRASAEEVLAVL